MYYYKTYYLDGTYSHLATKNPIRNKKEVCTTCTKVQIKSFLWYAKEWIIEKFLNLK